MNETKPVPSPTHATEKQKTPKTSATTNSASINSASKGEQDHNRLSQYMPPAPVITKRIAGKIKKPIVLVGLMGTGKSVLGFKLAHALGVGFADSDEETEKAAGMSIANIFETMGEDKFRDGEQRVIERLLTENHGVIALGGGAFENKTTRSSCLEKALCIWLDTSIDTLVERVGRNNRRPLLQNQNPKTVLQKLYETRKPAYQQAHLHVQSDWESKDKSFALLLHQLDSYLISNE